MLIVIVSIKILNTIHINIGELIEGLNIAQGLIRVSMW